MWKVGIPSDPSADMGALISKAHLEKVSKTLCVSFRKKFLNFLKKFCIGV